MKLTRRRAVSAIAATVGAVSLAPGESEPAEAVSRKHASRTPDAVEQLLWYDRPARNWLEALPLGNGRLGAMVFGGVREERLQLNEGTLWAGGPHNYDNPEALAALPEIRKHVFAGEWHAAQDLINAHFMSRPLRQAPYQALGDLRVYMHSDTDEVAKEYRRQLDLDSATCTVSYLLSGVRYTRELFASAPDQAIVVRFTADRRGQISFRAELGSLLKFEKSVVDDRTIAIVGVSGNADGVPGAVGFAALAHILAEGGTTTSDLDGVHVTGADSVTLLLTMATSYENWKGVGGDAMGQATIRLKNATRPYARLLKAHLADYRTLFRRVSIVLKSEPSPSSADAHLLPTNLRIAAFASGKDPGLAALHFQFGRYLLISCSRLGGQPATLQGLWNDSLDPPWGSKYTVNINTEMNYWPAAGANLLECYAPLFQMVHELSDSGRATAQTHYGAGGWVCHHNTNGWRGAAPIDGAFWGMWPCGGAWLCKSFWDHFEFTGDKQALRKAYPVLKGAAEFFLDALVEESVHHWLVTCPSVSPENGHHAGASICAGPTMDMQILRDLFDSVASASEVLAEDDEFRARVRATRARLAPMQIGRQGQLQEWLEDWDAVAPEQNHRHVSHLYGLFPSRQISARGTPELFAAARKSLETRGDPATGWSLAWKINLWARLLDGDHAYKLLADLISPERTAPNLFDLHPPFQIDGNFGSVSGVTEMLLQSQNGEVHLLPALPSAWPTGAVRGLRARGALVIDIVWRHGELDHANIRSEIGGRYRVRYREQNTELAIKKGESVRWPHSRS